MDKNLHSKIIFPTLELLNYYIKKAVKNVTILVNSSSQVIGKTASKYKLSSFNKNILKFTNQVESKVLDLTESTSAEKLSIMLTGAPGTGKTSWANAFAKEVLSKLGYLIIQLDSNSLADFTPPPYINKVCLIINDGDNLALSRENRSDGFTERVMSLLDGNQINCINPFNNSNIKLVTIITANTTERWDKAALRKGRIDMEYEFTTNGYSNTISWYSNKDEVLSDTEVLKECTPLGPEFEAYKSTSINWIVKEHINRYPELYSYNHVDEYEIKPEI